MVESLLEIITKRKGQKFYKPIDVNSVINGIDEIEVDMFFLQLRLGWVVNKLKGKGAFS